MHSRHPRRKRSGFQLIITWVVISLLLLGAAGFFTQWKKMRLANLEAGSGLMLLPQGEMEFADRGTGPAALVIHGSPGGYDQGLAYGKELAKRGFRIISISRPGYLRTPLLTGLTAEDQADAIDALLQGLKVSRCAVVGVSEGSPCALQLAVRHPEKVGSLVLLSPIAESLKGPPIASIGYQLFHDLTGDFGCWLLMLHLKINPSQVFAEMMKIGSSLKPSGCDALASKAMLSPDQRSFLSELVRSITPLLPREPGILNDNAQLKDIPFIAKDSIRAPTLLLVGEHNSCSPYPAQIRLASQITDSRILFIDQAGHILPIGSKYAQHWDSIANFMKSPSLSSIPRPPVSTKKSK
jgi:pimeloyl-ACP methyl ester carboxylesterase